MRLDDRIAFRVERDGADRRPIASSAALHIFLSAIERVLRQPSPGASAASRLGAVVFIHRFGALLNTHLHFHCVVVVVVVVVDGVFEADATGGRLFTRQAHWMCPRSGTFRPRCADDCRARSCGAASCRRSTRR